jgi:hypothetical protein
MEILGETLIIEYRGKYRNEDGGDQVRDRSFANTREI